MWELMLFPVGEYPCSLQGLALSPSRSFLNPLMSGSHKWLCHGLLTLTAGFSDAGAAHHLLSPVLHFRSQGLAQLVVLGLTVNKLRFL